MQQAVDVRKIGRAAPLYYIKFERKDYFRVHRLFEMKFHDFPYLKFQKFYVQKIICLRKK